MDADRLSLGETPGCVADESESPPGPEPDTELSLLNSPMTEFFCLGFAIPPTLNDHSVHHKDFENVKCMVIKSSNVIRASESSKKIEMLMFERKRKK